MLPHQSPATDTPAFGLSSRDSSGASATSQSEQHVLDQGALTAGAVDRLFGSGEAALPAVAPELDDTLLVSSTEDDGDESATDLVLAGVDADSLDDPPV